MSLSWHEWMRRESSSHRSPLITVEGMTEIVAAGNHHRSNWFGWESSIDVKTWWVSVWGRTGYLDRLRVSSHITVINFKEKNSNFAKRKPGRHRFNRVLDVTFGRGRTRCTEKAPARLPCRLPKMQHLGPGEGKHLKTPIKGRSTKSLACSLQQCQGHDRQGTVPS